MKLREFVHSGQLALEKAELHFSDSLQHMEQLVMRSLDWTPTQYFLKKEEELGPQELKKLQTVLERRLRAEPLQYILGFEYFYESRFEVGPGCLIPRKETEILVDELLKIPAHQKLRIAELGAGSGNIGISVLLKRPQWEWHAVELNPESLVFATLNQKKLLPKENSYFLHEGDFFQWSPQLGPFDVVVSNPPYVSLSEMKALPKEVAQEPHLALEAGKDGLKVIRQLLDELPRLLKPQGVFLTEIGAGQEEALKKDLVARQRGSFEVFKDLSGHPRVLKIQK